MILCESTRIKRSAFRHNEKSFLNYSLFTLHYSSFISESFRIFPSTLSSQNEFAAPSLLPCTKRQLSENEVMTNRRLILNNAFKLNTPSASQQVKTVTTFCSNAFKQHTNFIKKSRVCQVFY